jgi:hypothetical protein
MNDQVPTNKIRHAFHKVIGITITLSNNLFEAPGIRVHVQSTEGVVKTQDVETRS